jgi:hypothetical protein
LSAFAKLSMNCGGRPAKARTITGCAREVKPGGPLHTDILDTVRLDKKVPSLFTLPARRSEREARALSPRTARPVRGIWSHWRFEIPLIHFIPDSLRQMAPLFLKR